MVAEIDKLKEKVAKLEIMADNIETFIDRATYEIGRARLVLERNNMDLAKIKSRLDNIENKEL